MRSAPTMMRVLSLRVGGADVGDVAGRADAEQHIMHIKAMRKRVRSLMDMRKVVGIDILYMRCS